MRIIHAEITVQILILHPLVDIIDRTLVQPAALGLGIKIQAASVRHGDTELCPIGTDMGKGGHTSVRNGVQDSDLSGQIDFADFIILNIIDNLPLPIQAYTGLTKSEILGSVKVNIAFQDAVMVLRKRFFLSREHIAYDDIGMSALITDHIDAFIALTQGRAGKI